MVVGGSSAWSSVRIPAGRKLYTSTYDIEAYFYRCGVPSDLGRFFSLRGVPRGLAEDLGADVAGLRGKQLFRFLTVVPMGFSWSMWIAQRVHVHLSLRASLLPASQHLARASLSMD